MHSSSLRRLSLDWDNGEDCGVEDHDVRVGYVNAYEKSPTCSGSVGQASIMYFCGE